MKGIIRKFQIRSIPFVTILLTLSPALKAQSDANKTYKANCVPCHAADGSGNSPAGKALQAKDLGSTEVQKKSDKDLNDIITNGKGKMPAFSAKLKEEDIKGLVVYVRTLAKK